MGNSLIIKRMAAPTSWQLRKKEAVFVTRPHPGAQTYRLGTALTTILRDLLKMARTAREVRYILNKKEVIVNGIRRKDGRFLAGFMDTLSFPGTGQHYRMTLSTRGKLALVTIDEADARKKPAKVIGKTHIRGKVQLNLNDGRNMLVEKDTYKPGDSILFSLPDQKAIDHLKLGKDATIILTDGTHKGKIGAVEDIAGDIIMFRVDGEVFRTKKAFAFVLGKGQPAIKVQ